MTAVELGWGLDIILWFQSWRTPLIEVIGRLFHYAGSEEFYLTILPLIYWCADASFGRRFGPLFLISLWSNAWLKAWWQRPRPFMMSSQVRVPSGVEETSYGLPSGHAQGSTVLWGGIALEVKRRWALIVVVVYILLMAISRMVVGVHYPQDVLGGLLIGLIVLGLYIWLEPKISRWVKGQSLWTQIGLVVAAAALMLVIHPGLFPASSPPWLAQPVPYDEQVGGSVTPAASLLGLGIGFALEVRYSRFDARGVWWKRVLRFLLGLVGILALRFGLKELFDGWEPVLVFRLIRYSLIGLWAGFAAPWLFVTTKLADQLAEKAYAG